MLNRDDVLVSLPYVMYRHNVYVHNLALHAERGKEFPSSEPHTMETIFRLIWRWTILVQKCFSALLT